MKKVFVFGAVVLIGVGIAIAGMGYIQNPNSAKK